MKKNWNELDFEIAFLEGVVERSPDYVEALMMLASHYTQRGAYAKGLDLDLRLSRLKPEDETVQYNLACSYSLLSQINEAFASLKRAVALGFRNLKLLTADSDLDNTRPDPRFEEIVASVKNRRKKKK